MQDITENIDMLSFLSHNISQREVFVFLDDIFHQLSDGLKLETKKEAFIRSINLSLLHKHDSFTNHLTQLLSAIYERRKERSNQVISTDEEYVKYIQIMKRLAWPLVFEDLFIKFIANIVDNRVREVCQGNYSEQFFVELCSWVDSSLSGFILDIYGNLTDNCKVNTIVATIKSKYVYKSISILRATELFDITADYPDSLPALTELRDAVSKSDSIGEVGQIFRGIVKKRLLHIGASTSQILDMYILIIKALRFVDSTDLLLNFVSRPVRKYLLGRKDTVRCITVSLTDNPDSNLHGELRKGGAVSIGNDLDEEDDAPPSDNWMPRKRNPLLVDTTKSRSNDILAALVSIYGSTDVFVQEYRILLAEKLLSNTNYNIDQELATVELLKIRFVWLSYSSLTC